MPLPKEYKILIRNLSSSASESSNWRTRVQESQLTTQVSSILLQRQTKYWAPLLKSTLKLTKLHPSLFLRVLENTKSSPQMSLTFFNWAKKNLDFQPDLKSQCKLTHLLVGYGQAELAKPILDSIILDYPLGRIVSCFHKVANFETCSPVLCSVLEGYCRRGLFLEALEVYWKAKKLGTGTVSVYTCNALLSLLQDKNEVRLAWCFYGSMIRNGVSENPFTWSVVARILCKDGKFERIRRILDMGICNPSVYSLIIQNYSERGKFDATFDYVVQMHDKKLDPSFSIYSSILDAACKYQDEKVINVVMAVMKDKGYLPKGLILHYDSIIQKVADLGKTYAAGLLFDRACAEKVELLDATYGCMLRALSNDGRMKDASRMYGVVRERKMVVKDSCYYAFVNGLCTQTPSKEIHDLLKDVIGKGFDPCVAQLSEHIKAQCEHCRWKEAEELLILILDKGLLLPDPDCCCSLVKYYCSRRQIDSAIMLHNKMKMLGGNFDIPSYNTLLNKLFKESRVEEALEVFDYMTIHKIFSTESFAIMIRELCYLKEFRKAMKLHDEMLRLGLKPNGRTYKRLISGFG